MSTVVVAVIVALSAMISPIILATITGRQRRQERREDYARQDEVAKRLQKTQQQVATDAAAVAATLVDSNNKIAESTTVTNTKLDVIHTLVNSNMTAAMQSELDATLRELAMMREVLRLNEIAGVKPTPETLAAIHATELKTAELQAILNDRNQVTTEFTAAAAAAAAAAPAPAIVPPAPE